MTYNILNDRVHSSLRRILDQYNCMCNPNKMRSCRQRNRSRSVTPNERKTVIPALMNEQVRLVIPTTRVDVLRTDGSNKKTPLRLTTGAIDDRIPRVQQSCSNTNKNPKIKVKSRTRSRSRSNEMIKSQKYKPEKNWASTLKKRESFTNDFESIPSTHFFDGFDPLRTLHFLIKELKSKTRLTGDIGLNRVVNDMQEVLQRLPSDISRTNSSTTIKENVPPTKDTTVEKSTQTSTNCLINPKQIIDFQKKMDEGMCKLEETCRTLEMNCSKLRDERDYLKKQVQEKNEALLKLQDDINKKEKEFYKKNDALMEQMNVLNQEVEKLKADTNQSRKLQIHIEHLEKELEKAQCEATIARMDAEKLYVLIDTRDKQMDLMNAEFSQIQSYVNNHLTELADVQSSKSRDVSTASSLTEIVLRSPWKELNEEGIIAPDKIPRSPIHNSSVQNTSKMGGGDETEEIIIQTDVVYGRPDLDENVKKQSNMSHRIFISSKNGNSGENSTRNPIETEQHQNSSILNDKKIYFESVKTSQSLQKLFEEARQICMQASQQINY